MSVIDYRPADISDMQAIINLHVSLSQKTYAHILPEAYLRDVVPGEKQALWQRRFASPKSLRVITVATHNQNVEGFCCFPLDEETEFGTYLHNLYVSSDLQGKGVAKSLLRQAIDTFDLERKAKPVHLVAFVRNTRAVAIYDRLGGRVIDRSEVTRAGNPPVELVRYQWPSANQLADQLRS